MREIYLDNSATTRVDDDVAAMAVQVMCDDYGNASSLHAKGLAAQLRLDMGRQQLAAALGCRQEEVVFTSGGTEANNLAIQGAVQALRRRGKTLVAMAWEHSSVLEPLRALAKQGFVLRLIDPLPDGTVDADALVGAVDEDTIFVSCMLINSEVGAIAPVADIARRIRRRNKTALLHTDAVQAFGKIEFSATKLGVDLLSVSGHKLHAPKGVGALYIRRGARILPQIIGGGQERGMRAGTENVPLAAAFGLAAEKASKNLQANLAHVRQIREYFVNNVAEISALCMNSPPDSTPYICNLSLPGYRSEILLHFLAQRGVYVSSGSACTRGAASHVLRAMGLSADRVDSALRVSFSHYNIAEEIDKFFEALSAAMQKLVTTGHGSFRGATGGV